MKGLASKLEIVLWVVLLWLLGTAVYAYYYVVTMLAWPEPYDAYARNWSFQLMAFCLVRLPWLVLLLAAVVGVMIALPNRKTGPYPPADVSTN